MRVLRYFLQNPLKSIDQFKQTDFYNPIIRICQKLLCIRMAGEGRFTQQITLGELLGGLVHEAVRRVAGPTALDAAMTLDLGGEALDARDVVGGELDLEWVGVARVRD